MRRRLGGLLRRRLLNLNETRMPSQRKGRLCPSAVGERDHLTHGEKVPQKLVKINADHPGVSLFISLSFSSSILSANMKCHVIFPVKLDVKCCSVELNSFGEPAFCCHLTVGPLLGYLVAGMFMLKCKSKAR